MKAERIILIAILAVALAGFLPGQKDSDPVIDLLGEALLDRYEWRMFSNNVAGTGGSGGYSGQNEFAVGSTGDVGKAVIGTTWLYNAKTGKVYRVYTGCGDDEGRYGCLYAMPVFSPDRMDDYLPSPTAENSPQFAE